MHLWRAKFDPKADRPVHALSPGFGHSLLGPVVANVFESLGVSVSLWEHGYEWFAIHGEPNVSSFELEHGAAEGRSAYNRRHRERVQKLGKAVRGDHAGYSDLFVPIVARGRSVALLVAGPFATAWPTAADIVSRWRALTRRQGHLADPEFSAYLAASLGTLVLDGRRAAQFEEMLGCFAALPAAQVLVDPLHSGTAYVGTCGADGKNAAPGAGIWKTTDCGAAWNLVNTGRKGAELTAGCQWSHAIDPVAPDTLYFNAGYGTSSLYKSTNGGVDWDIVWPPPNDAAIAKASTGFVGGIHIDPYAHNHLLLDFHDTCGTFADQIGCFAESKDGGATWRLIFGTSTFEPQVKPYFLDDRNTWLIASKNMLWRSTDSGATWTSIYDFAATGDYFNDHSPGEMVRVAGGVFYYNIVTAIMRSTDGIHWADVFKSNQWFGALLSTGTNLYSNGQTLFSAPISDGTNWKEVPNNVPAGGGLGYDPPHHLLYDVNMKHGVFRMVVD